MLSSLWDQIGALMLILSLYIFYKFGLSIYTGVSWLFIILLMTLVWYYVHSRFFGEKYFWRMNQTKIHIKIWELGWNFLGGPGGGRGGQ